MMGIGKRDVPEEQGVHARLVACLQVAMMQPGRRNSDDMMGLVAVEGTVEETGAGTLSRDGMTARDKRQIPVRRLVGHDADRR